MSSRFRPAARRSLVQYPSQEEQDDEEGSRRSGCVPRRGQPRPAPVWSAVLRIPSPAPTSSSSSPPPPGPRASARRTRPLVAAVAQELGRAHGGAVDDVYQYALKGFSARLTADQADALADDPRVDYVEADQVFHTLATQTPATWGLDRVDQRDLPLNNTYTYNQTGQGVQRLHHRHRHPRHPPAVRRQDRQRLHGRERRKRHERLQRPRHARRGHRRRHDLRPGQAGHAPRRARAQLLGLGLERGRHRRRRLGHPEPRQARRGEHEPRRRRLDGARPGRRQLDQLRRQLRDRRGQLQRQRVQQLSGPRSHRPTRSAPRPTPTRAPRSPTSARASTSSRRARTSPRPGTPATPPPTRSAGRRWRLRTWPALSLSISRRTRPHRRRRRRRR